jgi:hypothetical protein
MQPPQPRPLQRRRSRVFITLFLLLILALSVMAALLIQRGLEDEALQEQLRELRETHPR